MYVHCMCVDPKYQLRCHAAFFVELSFELLSVLQALLASTVTLPNIINM